MGAEHPQVELDSRVSVVSVGPRGGGGLPPQTLQLTPSAPGPLPAQAARYPDGCVCHYGSVETFTVFTMQRGLRDTGGNCSMGIWDEGLCILGYLFDSS